MEHFLQSHNMAYRRYEVSEGTRYTLEHCPFDENHKGSAVFVYSSGAIGFNCFHSSCANRKWHDVRVLLDPNAYDRAPSVCTVQSVRKAEESKMPQP